MSDILSMLVLRDRVKQILMEPTLDKAFTGFSSIMLVAFTVTLLSPLLTGSIQYELLIMEAVSCVLAALIGILYKHFDQTARDATSKRLKKDIDHDYLIRNPKLKEINITLDCLEMIQNEMSIMRQLLAAALNHNSEHKVDGKYYDPNIVNTQATTTPWNNVTGDTQGHENKDDDE